MTREQVEREAERPDGDGGPWWYMGQWFYIGELEPDGTLLQYGYCPNPRCIDPKADPEERRKAGLPTGRFWGANTKRLLCTCGERVGLT